ncbi:hypothetical protein EVAR_9373_1 [Eumeta japonica]|uniref:Uncharacterized protein n=1 Tax=Eumeta variegata TaxID=151549 RepID=A0A4C1YVM0_EUMVA|nr:hypothetical protein EVAR_9373_1 [Eumeta japonica]
MGSKRSPAAPLGSSPVLAQCGRRVAFTVYIFICRRYWCASGRSRQRRCLKKFNASKASNNANTDVTWANSPVGRTAPAPSTSHHHYHSQTPLCQQLEQNLKESYLIMATNCGQHCSTRKSGIVKGARNTIPIRHLATKRDTSGGTGLPARHSRAAPGGEALARMPDRPAIQQNCQNFQQARQDKYVCNSGTCGGVAVVGTKTDNLTEFAEGPDVMFASYLGGGWIRTRLRAGPFISAAAQVTRRRGDDGRLGLLLDI